MVKKRENPPPRDRNRDGRAEQSRPRDSLGRPLPYGQVGVPALPDPLPDDADSAVVLAQKLLDEGLPFQAHEVFEEMWKSCPAEQRPGWQGLAQLAVAITHNHRGNIRGARLLLDKAKANLTAGVSALPTPVDQSGILAWLDSAQYDLNKKGTVLQPLKLVSETFTASDN